MTAPILQYPDWDKPFILTTDASNVALGAVLSQGTIGRDRPIAYASRTLNQAETRYTTTEKELLAIVWATKHFHQCLYGRKFTIITDHRPLVWLMNVKDPNFRLMRWRLKLLEYDYEIIYKQGNINTNADTLSRIRVRTIEDDVTRELEKYITLYSTRDRSSINEENDFIKGLIGTANQKELYITKHAVMHGNINIHPDSSAQHFENTLCWLKDDNSLVTLKYTDEQTYKNIKTKLLTLNPNLKSTPINLTAKLTTPAIQSEILVRQGYKKDAPTITYTELPPDITENDKTYISPHETDRTKLETIIALLKDGYELNIVQDRDYKCEILQLLQLLSQLKQNLTLYFSKQTPVDKIEIIRLANDSIFGGHYAFEKSLQKIRKHYNWSNITTDIKTYIETCETC